MQLSDYLNSISDSYRLRDYTYGILLPKSTELSDSDKETLEFIIDIIRLKENYKEKERVFEQFSSKRLPVLKSITKEDLSLVAALNIDDYPLPIRARIADFLWTTIKDPKSARIAIQSYIELYELLWDEDHWPDCVDAIIRAVNIACSFNKKGQEYDETSTLD